MGNGGHPGVLGLRTPTERLLGLHVIPPLPRCEIPDVRQTGLYGVVATLQPAGFGRVYAAYGGIFIAMALLWG